MERALVECFDQFARFLSAGEVRAGGELTDDQGLAWVRGLLDHVF